MSDPTRPRPSQELEARCSQVQEALDCVAEVLEAPHLLVELVWFPPGKTLPGCHNIKITKADELPGESHTQLLGPGDPMSQDPIRVMMAVSHYAAMHFIRGDHDTSQPRPLTVRIDKATQLMQVKRVPKG